MITPQNVVMPTVRDPNTVEEKLANGPININVLGSFTTLTFTQMRADTAQLFKGKMSPSDVSAVVVARITIPTESLVQLKATLEQTVVALPLTPGGTMQ